MFLSGCRLRAEALGASRDSKDEGGDDVSKPAFWSSSAALILHQYNKDLLLQNYGFLIVPMMQKKTFNTFKHDVTAVIILSLSCPVCITHAGRRHDHDTEAAVHPGGDGPSADGEESVQRETYGASGGSPVDRNDQVDEEQT